MNRAFCASAVLLAYAVSAAAVAAAEAAAAARLDLGPGYAKGCTPPSERTTSCIVDTELIELVYSWQAFLQSKANSHSDSSRLRWLLQCSYLCDMQLMLSSALRLLLQ